MRDILNTIAKWWDSGETFGLATVVDTFSSAPRDPGAALAVEGGGEVIGSVSGGCVRRSWTAGASGRPILSCRG